MDTNVMIRTLNAFTKPHFTNAGHHMATGDMSLDGLVLAAWYTVNALDSGNETVKRVCDLLRAKEELGKVHQHTIMSGEHPAATANTLCDVLNAIAWATSLVCDHIRALELTAKRKR